MKIKSRLPMEKRFLFMRNEVSSWLPAYRDIQRFIIPTRGFFYDTVPNWGRQIDHKTQLNGAPGRAAKTLAAGMLSGLASPSRPWFKLGLENEDLMQNQEVKQWLSIAEDRMKSIFSKSNTYETLHNMFEELGSFGTAAAIVLEDFDSVIRCRTFTAGEYAIGQDSNGRVNSFCRRFNMTVGQLVQEYGIDNCSMSVQAMYKNGIVDPWIKIDHLIEPNDERIEDRSDYENKKFRSLTWEMGSPPNTCLRISGYDEFPVLAPRWDTTTTAHIYGWGPGHNALGDTKMLMKLEKDYLVALDKVIDPPIQQDASVQGEANTLPGGVVKSSTMNPNAGVRAAYQINPDLNAAQAKIDRTMAAIDSTFYKDLFLMLSQSDSPQKTAFEISKRYEEKLLMLGPVIERQENELLDPLIERTFAIGLRTGVIPPPPPVVGGQELKIEYISTLAQAQKMVGTQAIEQVTTFVQTIMQADPNAIDNIDVDETIRTYADMLGVPPKLIHPQEIVDQVRQDKAQAQAQAQAEQKAMALTQNAKTLSETKIGGGNALEALTGTSPEAEQAA